MGYGVDREARRTGAVEVAMIRMSEKEVFACI